MARRTVKVVIPYNRIDEFITLCERIVDKYEKPVNVEDNPRNSGNMLLSEDVAALKILILKGKPLRDKSIQLREQSEKLMEQFRITLGIDKGQTASTRGTGLFLVDKIKKGLLSEFQSEEEQLSEYGFNVVVKLAKSYTKKSK